MELVTCGWCGTEFVARRIQRRKYCCQECYWKAKKTIPPVAKCRHCGSEFKPDAGNNMAFCNRACYRAWRAAKTEYVVVPCQHCGREIKKPRKRAWTKWIDGKPLPRKYCSKKCADMARVGKYIDADAPQWRGGRTSLQDIIRKSNQYEALRKACFARDGYASVLSGLNGRLVHHHLIAYSILFDRHGINRQNWREFPAVLFDLDNVVTLRELEHREFHSLYGKVTTPEQFQEYIATHRG